MASPLSQKNRNRGGVDIWTMEVSGDDILNGHLVAINGENEKMKLCDSYNEYTLRQLVMVAIVLR